MHLYQNSMLYWNDRLVDWQKIPLCPTLLYKLDSNTFQKLNQCKSEEKPALLVLSYVFFVPWMNFCCPLLYFLAWIGFGFKVWGTEDSLSDRGPLLLPPCWHHHCLLLHALLFVLVKSPLYRRCHPRPLHTFLSQLPHMWCFPNHICYFLMLRSSQSIW